MSPIATERLSGNMVPSRVNQTETRWHQQKDQWNHNMNIQNDLVIPPMINFDQVALNRG